MGSQEDKDKFRKRRRNKYAESLRRKEFRQRKPEKNKRLREEDLKEPTKKEIMDELDCSV